MNRSYVLAMPILGRFPWTVSSTIPAQGQTAGLWEPGRKWFRWIFLIDLSIIDGRIISMNWADQNTAGISWSHITESIRKMWAVYHAMPDDSNKAEMRIVIEDITNKFLKMSGIIGD